ncbi:hypothetical protein SDC9_130502 [bioreactor metagenome]|uniref:Uncharacterized protein n=1 Tax=bioreactor metagenome TaxID=1076179 RepID=A0A645D2Z8_9ZZZZ
MIVKARRNRLISVTAFNNNELNRLSDHCLYCSTDDVHTESDDTISRSGMMIVADLLLHYIREEKYNKERLHK